MLGLRRFLSTPRTRAPEPTQLDVQHGGRRFEVVLRRHPAARRMTLRVSGATGEVVLTLPPRASLLAAKTFLDQHGGWISDRVARLPDRILFEPGVAVPLRGVPHRIVHWSQIRSATRATVDADGAAVIAVAGDEAGVPGRVRRFLQAEAQADLKAAVSRHAERLDVAVGRVTLRDTRSRWGSCSSTGTLSFSWRMILAPPSVLDYLAAHEVAHLRELNHSHRFWRIVHDLCPGTEEAERWLKRHGTALHRYG